MADFAHQKVYAMLTREHQKPEKQPHVVDIWVPSNIPVSTKVKTNSKFTQKVTLDIGHPCKVGDQSQETTQLEFSGSGEYSIIGQQKFILEGYKSITATFEYATEDGIVKPSVGLKTGGPYDVGQYHMFVVVAENGDDSDFNDSVLEFSWYTPK